jgi:hypothetical protein
VEPTVLIQGVIFSFLGLILVSLSGKIARMPREHKALFLRLSLFGETALTRLFERDRVVGSSEASGSSAAYSGLSVACLS